MITKNTKEITGLAWKDVARSCFCASDRRPGLSSTITSLTADRPRSLAGHVKRF